MKYFVRFLSLCLGVLLFHSCLQEENDLSPTPTGISQSPAVLKARAAFEDYASQDIDYQISGLHPGCISPKWEEVKVFSQPEEATIGFDVPLVTEATYEGSFYVDTDTSAIRTDTYRTALLQKLVIAQSLKEDVYGLYIATIIPDAEHATLNREKIASMFYGGDLDTRFSGTVMYSTVTTNLTVQVERYRNGELCDIVSLFDKELDYLAKLKAMKQLIGAKSLKRTVRTLTRSGEMSGGMLPPVFVEPTNPTPSVPSLPPPPNPPYPDLPPGSSTIPPIQPPGKGSGNYNGGNHDGGSTTSKTPNVDKIYNNSSTLTQAEKEYLENILVEMKKCKAYQLLFEALEKKGIKFQFKMQPNLNVSATFHFNNTIEFQDKNGMYVGIKEELVHALQYNVLYGEAMNTNNIDYRFSIEWEAHIFVDAASVLQDNQVFRSGYNTIFHGSDELKEMHYSLMNAILKEEKFTYNHIELFKETSKYWKQYKGNYKDDFTPKGLLNYIKK